MSKHVWRGTRYAIVVHPGLSRTNCTVIEDYARFPVKEAMRVVAMAEEVEASITDDGSMLVPEIAYLSHVSRLSDALFKYRKAVARMNARKGKR